MGAPSSFPPPRDDENDEKFKMLMEQMAKMENDKKAIEAEKEKEKKDDNFK